MVCVWPKLLHDFYCGQFLVWTWWCCVLVVKLTRECVCCSCWLGLHSTSFCHEWDNAAINSKSELISFIKIGSKDRPVSKLVTGLNFLSLIPCRGRIFPFHAVCRISCFTYPWPMCTVNFSLMNRIPGVWCWPAISNLRLCGIFTCMSPITEHHNLWGILPSYLGEEGLGGQLPWLIFCGFCQCIHTNAGVVIIC